MMLYLLEEHGDKEVVSELSKRKIKLLLRLFKLLN